MPNWENGTRQSSRKHHGNCKGYFGTAPKIGHRHRENQCRHPLLMPPLQKEEWWRDEFTYKILMHPKETAPSPFYGAKRVE